MKTIPNKLNQNFIKMKKRFIKNHQKTKRRYDHANKAQYSHLQFLEIKKELQK